jgi:hypothetical protein
MQLLSREFCDFYDAILMEFCDDAILFFGGCVGLLLEETK